MNFDYDRILSAGSYYRARNKIVFLEVQQVYSMKQACELTEMTYENLKFYCNQGLVPNVKRDSRNYRVFDDYDIEWIKSLNCLKKCDMSILEMKEYINLCLEGEKSIPARKKILEAKRETLLEALAEIQSSINYIDWKQGFYEDVLSGKTEYYSNLRPQDRKSRDEI
jgi:MerR family transcriptional regulator, aldehyde-responsive regulator